MDRRRFAFAGMWIGAIGAMAVLYLTQERAPDASARSGDRATLRTPDDRGAIAVPSTPPSPPEPGPPRQYRLDRRHTARSPYGGPSTANVAFRAQTNDHVSAQAIVGDDGTIYVGSHDHFFYAFAADGQVRWRVDLGAPIYSTGALVGDRVYVGSDVDRFFALDARDGRVLWHLATEDDADTGIAIGPDGALYFGAGSDLFCVTADGEVRWRFRTGLKIFSAPAVDDDGSVYFGSQDDHVYALDRDGRMRWRHHAGEDVDGSPVIGDDGTIYVGTDDERMLALRRDGSVRWSVDVGGDVRAPVGLGLDGSIYVSVFSPRARVVALDAATGQQRWEFALSAQDTSASVGSGVLVDRNGHLYFGADDDFVYSLASDGRLRWFVRTDANVDSDPVLMPDGTLLVGSDDERLWAIRDR